MTAFLFAVPNITLSDLLLWDTANKIVLIVVFISYLIYCIAIRDNWKRYLPIAVAFLLRFVLAHILSNLDWLPTAFYSIVVAIPAWLIGWLYNVIRRSKEK